MAKRILVIGTNKEYCFQIKEFFELRGLITTIVLDYNEGLEKLLFEKPHITVIEYTSKAISATFLSKINQSGRLHLVENDSYLVDKDRYPVFIFQDIDKMKVLFDNIEKALQEVDFDNLHVIAESQDGDLSKVFFPRLLKEIEAESRTGVLIIDSNFQIKIYFENGTPVYSEGGNVETGLARILLNNSKIDLDKYNEVINEVTDKDNNQKIGEILVSKGFISPHELNTYLELQVKEKIIRGFLFTKGTYSFRYTDELPSEIYHSKFNINDIILEGMNRYLDVSGLYDQSLQIKILAGFSKKVVGLSLGPRELRVTQMLRNKSSLDEIYEKGRLSKEKIIKLLFYLAFHEIIELKDISIDSIGISSCRKMSEKLDLIDESDLLILDESNVIKEQKIDQAVAVDSEVSVETSPRAIGEELTIESLDKLPSIDDITQEDITEQLEEFKIENLNDDNIEADIQYYDTPTEEFDVGDDQLSLNEEKENLISEDQALNLEDNVEDHKNDKEYLEWIEEQGVDIEKKEENHEENNELVLEYHDFISKEEDFYKILQVSEDAESDEIRMSYLELVKKFHPDIAIKYSSDIKDKAEEIFSKLTIAYETLSDENMRDTYDSRSELDELKGKAGEIYEAEVCYKEGELLLKQRNYKEAEAKLEEALKLNPNESAYLGAYSWARYCSSDDKDVILEDIRIKLETAVSMDPDLAQNYYYLGSIYKFSDNLFKAKQNYEKAVELDNNFIDAKRELRLITNRKIEEKGLKAKKINNKNIEKRFWSGLFKK